MKKDDLKKIKQNELREEVNYHKKRIKYLNEKVKKLMFSESDLINCYKKMIQEHNEKIAGMRKKSKDIFFKN